MERAFTPADNELRFKRAGADDRDWGLLEYPLADPGDCADPGAGILWFTHNSRMAARGETWAYVRPADVEPARAPWDDAPMAAPDEPAAAPPATVLVFPCHDPATCQACETKETVYSVRLHVVITMTGDPTCHTQAAIWENVLARLQAGDESDLGNVHVVEVNP